MTGCCGLYLACVGNANDPGTWSSTPYHFLQAGRAAGLLSEGLALNPHTRLLRFSRVVWNSWHVLLGGAGGFQHSVAFLEEMWKPVRGRLGGAGVVNHFHLYPPSIVADSTIEKWFYMDATVRQVVESYGMRVSRRTLNEVMAREREGYLSAAGVCTMSGFAAQSVIADYGVPREKVHVVVPGANITAEAYAQWESRQTRGGPVGEGPLKLVFVGREFHRKGLDRLLEALALGRRRGLRATLRVIGLSAADVPSHLAGIEGVEWCGLISRRTEPQRFFDLVSECHVGCLLSRAEFSAIALREYLAFGLAVIGPAVGGCMDLMAPEASLPVSAAQTPDEIAEILLELERDADRLEALRSAAWRLRHSALWSNSVRQFIEFRSSVSGLREPAASQA
ncbi:MAG TPA: glycosyltransferase family 4 protein [Tepidisphaeraceae bacterium]|nr:glycosyltransferase family 4 protein [Tepidisphaeraceae bacterium]